MRRSRRWPPISGLIASLVLSLLAGTAFAAGGNTAVRATAAAETQAVANANYFAWTRSSPRRPTNLDVFLESPSGHVRKVNREGTRAALGGISRGRLVYQEYTREPGPETSKIRIYDLGSRRTRTPPRLNSSRAWEYLPSIWRHWVVMGVQLPNRPARIVLVNLKTGRRRVIDEAVVGGYLEPGQINAGKVVWTEWTNEKRRPSVLQEYRIGSRVRHQDAIPGYEWEYAPAVGSNRSIYFWEFGRRCQSRARLYRQTSAKRSYTSAPDVILRLPSGARPSYATYVYRNRHGRLRVLYGKVPCKTREPRGDIFELNDTFRFAVWKGGNGSGTVASNGKIHCGGTCSQLIDGGAMLKLRARPDDGSKFLGWSYPCNEGSPDPECWLPAYRSFRVEARFGLDIFDPVTEPAP